MFTWCLDILILKTETVASNCSLKQAMCKVALLFQMCTVSFLSQCAFCCRCGQVSPKILRPCCRQAVGRWLRSPSLRHITSSQADSRVLKPLAEVFQHPSAPVRTRQFDVKTTLTDCNSVWIWNTVALSVKYLCLFRRNFFSNVSAEDILPSKGPFVTGNLICDFHYSKK